MSDHDKDKEHHHHILSNKTSLRVLLFLFLFTFITVVAAQFHFGALNFPIAMLIATLKAASVMGFFMGLKYDSNQNRFFFLMGFVFLGVFILFCATDLWTRHYGWKVKGQVLATATGGPTFEQPWISSPEIIAHGKTVYAAQACASCHGDTGHGDGPAGKAIGARNYHDEKAWKNGRKPSQVYMTLAKGLNLMPSFPTLSVSDRWAVAHYVLTFGAKPPEDTPEDLKKVGIDPSLPDGGIGSGPKKETVPVDFALERYVSQ